MKTVEKVDNFQHNKKEVDYKIKLCAVIPKAVPYTQNLPQVRAYVMIN